MDTISLKKYIYENNKIEYVLENIGNHHIKYHPIKEYYSCANYNGDNITAVNVKNNQYINVINYTREKDFKDGSDIFTLIQYNKQCSFVEAVKYLHSILGLEYTWLKKTEEHKEKKYNPIENFKRYESANIKKVDVNDIQSLKEEFINDYIPLLHIDWFRDGIMPWTAKKFGLAYSYKRKRVIIPMRAWDTGQLLGINARTTVENYEELGIKKYFITPSYPKLLNIYGLYENYKSILEAGYVVVYESERSVLKRDSLNDSTGVAISGHTMSDEQASILHGLNVDIIISMDKDIPREEVEYMCSKLCKGRNVYYTWDSYDLLGKKDSVADAPNKIFDFLMKHKVKYKDC